MADTMQEMKKPLTEPEPDISEEALAKAMSGELTEAQQKLIEELDKESSVRKLANSSLAKAFYMVCIAVTLLRAALTRRC